ncbi:MAG: DLW-39 family protein [Mycobacteriales bacterium]
MKRLLLLAGIVGGSFAMLRKRQAARDEADLWHEATTATSAPR